jgi:hypothetical protein
MKSNSLVWLLAALLVIAGVWYWFVKPRMTTPETMVEDGLMLSDSVTVQLAEQSNLGQTGTATLADNEDGMLVVTLALTGGEFDLPQPAHIHLGACPDPGAVEYPLTNVVGGQSTTVLDMSWADLETAGQALAINVHKSAAEASTYPACGDLPIEVGDAMMEEKAVDGDEAMMESETKVELDY